MSWQDVYERQMSLWSFWRSPEGIAFSERYSGDLLGRLVTENAGANAREVATSWMTNLHHYQETAAFIGEPVSLDRDMAALALAASRDFQPEPLQAADLITDAGFIYLPEPWSVPDRRGNQVNYRAVMWSPLLRIPVDDVMDRGPGRPKALLRRGYALGEPGGTTPQQDIEVTDVDTDDTTGLEPATFDTVEASSIGELSGRYPMEGVLVALYSLTTDIDDYGSLPESQAIHPLVLMHAAPWFFGLDFVSIMTERGEDPWAPGSFTYAAQQIQALFRLMQQTIAIRGRTRPPRPSRRRAARIEYPEKAVTVITLRRPHKDPDEGHEPRKVDWSHRWLVSGFWRNQWFPSLGLHRQVYINPYVKGPADKPLEIRQLRAWHLSR